MDWCFGSNRPKSAVHSQRHFAEKQTFGDRLSGRLNALSDICTFTLKLKIGLGSR